MQVKICGCSPGQLDPRLFELQAVDYFGFIFYPGSPRYVEHTPEIPGKKVGVFVNAHPEFILRKTAEEALDVIQFHGDESPEAIRNIATGAAKWKALGIQQVSDLEACKAYEGIIDLLLFDTKSTQYGGTGTAFDWNILEAYTGKTPFFLSGGISIEQAERIRNMQHPQLLGVDLNSRFENAYNQKNIPLIESFIKQLNYEKR